MGKCKKRTLYKANTSYFMTRESAVNDVFRIITEKSKKRTKFKDAVRAISLFGISAEELSEAGVPYENLKALSNVLT